MQQTIWVCMSDLSGPLGCLCALVISDTLPFPLSRAVDLQADLDDLNLPTSLAKAP